MEFCTFFFQFSDLFNLKFSICFLGLQQALGQFHVVFVLAINETIFPVPKSNHFSATTESFLQIFLYLKHECVKSGILSYRSTNCVPEMVI